MSLLRDHLGHQDESKAHKMNTDLDMMHSEGAIGLVPSSDGSDPVYRPFSPSINFDDLLTISMPRFGSPSFPQTHAIGVDDDFLWGLPSSSSILNRPLGFPPFLLETSIGSPIEENILPGDENQELVLGRAISVPGVQSQLEGARSFIASLVQHGKVTQCHGTGPSVKLEMPDVEDIMESLESLLPETDVSSRDFSDHTLSIQYASSSSNLFRTLIYSFTNNFAGLREVPRKALMKLLREHHDIRTQLFEVIKIGRPGVAKPLADSLFRAAVEGCDADAAATIIHHTKSNPKVAIDPNEIVCNFEDKDYTPIELAAKFRNTELVRTLLASNADPNKTYRQSEHDEYWEKGALALALGHWDNGSAYPFKPSPAGEPEPASLDLLRLLLDCGAEVRMDLLENAMRPGPGHTAIAEELVSRVPAGDHQTCFKSQWLLISMIHYLDNGAANRFVRRIFADCFDSPNCGKCISKNPQLVEKMLCHAARRPDIDLSEFLVHYTTRLQSGLAAAVRGGSEKLVQFLLDRGAHVDDTVESWDSPENPGSPDEYPLIDVYDENGYDRPTTYSISRPHYVITPIRTPLAEAIRAGDTNLINTFERLGGLTRLGEERHFQAAVLAAAEVGNTLYLKMILDRGPRLLDEASLTLALAVTIRNDETDAALLLLDAGANTYSYGRKHGHPLVKALERCNKRVVDSMLECVVYNRGHSNIDGKSTLEVAGSWCGIDVIKDLMRMGSDIDFGVEITALGAAVRSRNNALVHQLLDLGIKPNAKGVSSNGVTPLRAALEIGDYDMARCLIANGADTADPSAFAYTMGQDPAGYEFLMPMFKSQYPHGLPGFGGSLLAKAIDLGSHILIDSLLDAGADVNSWCTRDPWGVGVLINNERVLGYALKHHKGHCIELVRKLLRKGANPDFIVNEYDLRNKHGTSVCVLETPLVLAVKMKNPTLVSLLLEHGADLDMPARRGIKRTPLQAACETGNYKMVEFLLQRGANVNSAAAGRDGGTALQMAAKTGSLKIVKLLLENGADPHMAKSNVRGRTAFEAAAESGCIDVLCLLWNAVLPFGFSEKECRSAKDFAKENGHRGCVDFIDFLSGDVSQSFLD